MLEKLPFLWAKLRRSMCVSVCNIFVHPNLPVYDSVCHLSQINEVWTLEEAKLTHTVYNYLCQATRHTATAECFIRQYGSFKLRNFLSITVNVFKEWSKKESEELFRLKHNPPLNLSRPTEAVSHNKNIELISRTKLANSFCEIVWTSHCLKRFTHKTYSGCSILILTKTFD